MLMLPRIKIETAGKGHPVVQTLATALCIWLLNNLTKAFIRGN